jgi:transcription factor E
MLEKFLRDVVVIIVGKHAEGIVELLNSKKHVNEFIIAKKLEITINQTRNILYKLSDFGLVSSIRKKDKKKGWYTYFWKIEILKALEFLKDILNKRIGQIDSQISSRETKQFYVCERCNIEFNEENALLNDFTCNECGDIFTTKDNTKLLREFNRRSDKLKKELVLVDVEISKEEERLGKIRAKEFKKLEKEKAEASAIRRAEAAKKRAAKKLEKEKAEGITGKKKVVKKKAVKKKAVKKKAVAKKKVAKKVVKKKVVAKKTTKKKVSSVLKKIVKKVKKK